MCGYFEYITDTLPCGESIQGYFKYTYPAFDYTKCAYPPHAMITYLNMRTSQVFTDDYFTCKGVNHA
jgi:hypothetical protein